MSETMTRVRYEYGDRCPAMTFRQDMTGGPIVIETPWAALAMFTRELVEQEPHILGDGRRALERAEDLILVRVSNGTASYRVIDQDDHHIVAELIGSIGGVER